MAKLITEDQKSRTIDMTQGGGTSERFYTMKDYTEAEDAYRALLSYAPSNIYVAGFQMSITGVKVTPEFSDPQATLYRGSVSYASPTMGGQQNSKKGGGGGDPTNQPTGKAQEPEKEPTKPEDPSKVYFTFGTRTRTKLQALAQNRWITDSKGKWPARTDPKKNDLQINKDADDVAPEGVTVEDGAMFMHVVTVLDSNVVNADFYKTIVNTLMDVNLAPFAYFEAGQVQFQGADVELMVSGDYKVEYHFECRAFSSTQTFSVDTKGSTLSPISNDIPFNGFNYTWLTYQDVEKKDATDSQDGSSSTKIEYARKCDSINVAQVYRKSRWNTNACLKWCKPPQKDKEWQKG